MDVIRCHQPEFHIVPLALHGQFVASAVEMTVETAANFIFFQQCQNLGAFVTFVPGRIVEKYQFWFLPCRF